MGLVPCLWDFPHRSMWRLYFFGLMSLPHFGQVGIEEEELP
jgi:hypothetical protein